MTQDSGITDFMDLSPDEQEAILTVHGLDEYTKMHKFVPYPWQEEVYAAGKDFPERLIMAGNRCGKTYAAAYETACHATGIYPDWWEGYRIEEKNPLIWTAAITNESSRDIIQKELFGGSGELWGTGMIPKDMLKGGKPKLRQAGIPDVFDSIQVQNIRGGTTLISLKTYEQGWRKFQGTAPHFIWKDEEPDDMRLYTEARTRIMTSKGRILVTFTPLLGQTDLVMHYTAGKDGVYMKNVTWDDAPHLSQKDKEQLLASYPDYERDARAKGIPILGSGRVFPVAEEDIKVEPIEIPAHWARIAGMDFGWEHPTAVCWLAWDRDTDTIYVYDVHRKEKQEPAYHAAAINSRGKWIPVAWPHDGINERQGGDSFKKAYKDLGVKMLSESARYKNDKGGAQPVEPVIMEVLERCKTGRFKVFSTCKSFFEEFRSYHRDDGKLVAVREDILKACFYGVMMKRKAMPQYMAGGAKKQSGGRPIVSSVV